VPVRYPHITERAPSYVWAKWRMPTLQEVTWAKPIREPVGEGEKLARGWWLPDRGELRERIRRVRQLERMRRTRAGAASDEDG